MAVLVEAISVIVRKDVINKKMTGGWDGFLRLIPNRTLCFDDFLARVGFMTPPDVERFCNILEHLGLEFVKQNSFVDFAVVEQKQGPTAKCDWLKFSVVTFFKPPMTVSVCEFIDQKGNTIHNKDNSIKVAFPEDWDYEKSLSKDYNFVPTEMMHERMKLLRHENGMDVYLDIVTGKEVYVGRTK